MDPMPGATSPAATVSLLRPIRTLTIASDLAFRQRALTVLGPLGPADFAVAALGDPPVVVELVTRQQANVLVLDVSTAVVRLPLLLAELCARAPRVGVVLVADVATHLHPTPVLAKWGWAADLLHAVQDAYRRGNPLKELEVDDARH